MNNRRLLVIDDEETISRALERYFRRLGYMVDRARELEEAEALATYTEYSLVIADLSLTGSVGSEGLEILRYLRWNCPRARVILLTAHGSEYSEREAYRRGAHAFMHKPRPLADIARLATEITRGGVH
ncbi:MAG TPA: response regulator [Thermoanaerobaculia bacterium]|nr:response regulator [Thermoanaerobaculia bacterium]